MYAGFDDGLAVDDPDVDDDVVVDDIHLWSLHQDTSGAGRPPSTAQVNDNSWVGNMTFINIIIVMIVAISIIFIIPIIDVNMKMMMITIVNIMITWPRV